MQLRSISLYSHDGQRRDILLHPGRLNIITGPSQTGKSALLGIIEFCLGRRSARLPHGPITEKVSWFGLVVEVAGTRAFIGRPQPRGETSTRSMLRIGADADPVAWEALELNADAPAVRATLDDLVGLGAYEHESPTGALRANIGHA